jgi:hypothetical protein
MLAGKADGSGQSTKAPFQQLYDIDGPQVPHRVLIFFFPPLASSQLPFSRSLPAVSSSPLISVSPRSFTLPVASRLLVFPLSSLSVILCLSASHPLRKLGHPCLSRGGAGALVARLPHLRGVGGATSPQQILTYV